MWYERRACYKQSMNTHQHNNQCAPNVFSVILNCRVYDIARIAIDSNGFKWKASHSKILWIWSGGIHFQQTWFYNHNITSGLPSWNIFTLFFSIYDTIGMTGLKGHSRVGFHSSAYFCTHFWDSECPHGAVGEHITCSSCVMHICSNPALMPSQMTSSSPVHHELPVGVFLLLTILLSFHTSIILFLYLKIQLRGLIDLFYTHHNQSSSHYLVFLPKITIPWFCILFFKWKSHHISNFIILSWIFSKLCFFLGSETVLKKAFQRLYKHTHTYSVCATQRSSFYHYLMSFYQHLCVMFTAAVHFIDIQKHLVFSLARNQQHMNVWLFSNIHTCYIYSDTNLTPVMYILHNIKICSNYFNEFLKICPDFY